MADPKKKRTALDALAEEEVQRLLSQREDNPAEFDTMEVRSGPEGVVRQRVEGRVSTPTAERMMREAGYVIDPAAMQGQRQEVEADRRFKSLGLMPTTGMDVRQVSMRAPAPDDNPADDVFETESETSRGPRRASLSRAEATGLQARMGDKARVLGAGEQLPSETPLRQDTERILRNLEAGMDPVQQRDSSPYSTLAQRVRGRERFDTKRAPSTRR